jgi:enolase
LQFKDKAKSSPEKMLTTDQLCDIYVNYTKNYPIISIEDAFDQDDIEGWKQITSRIGDNIQIVGDDLLVTNKQRIIRGIE